MADWRTELGSWGDIAAPFLTEDWCRALTDRVEAAYEGDKPVYPPRSDLFTALRLTPPEGVRCVILGQDPYPGKGQAHGLAFSVRPGVAVPRSLNNIYKELESDLGISPAKTGSLIPWAEEGVLLLNNVLTVYGGEANSHKGWGWEEFTDAVIRELNASRNNLVFILWGGYAKKKGAIIDRSRHLVLSSAHPSPLSAYNGFFGNHHFSQANEWLAGHGMTPVEW